MHACQDALLAIYNGHIVAKACLELGIATADTIPPSTAVIDLKELATKIVDEFTTIPDAILGESMEETGDGIYNYA